MYQQCRKKMANVAGIRAGRFAIMACAFVLASASFACNLPIYKYALQRWPRTPYRVYYMHDGQSEDALDTKVNSYLEKVSFAGEGFANLIYIPVNVSDELPTEVDRLWPDNCDKELPFHAVFTPRSQPLLVESLTVKRAKLLAGSPMRKQIAKTLTKKQKQGLLLLLLDGSDKAIKTARENIKKAVNTAKKHDADVGVLEIKRDAPKEKLFVHQLLSMESDLTDLHEPMVFTVFGRGYVMSPFVGEGITTENMEAVIQFINGPCSCSLRSAGLGVEALTNFNWEEAILGPTGAPRPLTPGGHVTF